LALVFVLVVAGGFYFINRGNDPSISAGSTLRSAEDLAAAYREAQAAFQAGDWDQAISLLDAVLAKDSDYQDAASLRAQAQAKQSLEQAFEVGKAAYLAARWDAAIDELNGVRQADASLHASEVQDMLCDAYLQRGQMRLVDDSGASDTTTLETALQDFKAGLAVCPDHPALAKQQAHAEALLRAHKAEALQDYDAAIRELTPLVTAEPDYAAGSARRLLYAALVEWGDMRRQAGDLEGALADYEQALAVDGTDPLDATARRAEIIAEMGVATPPPAAAPEPTATPSDYKYDALTLLSPQNEALFQGRFATIVLEWQPVDALADDEYYDVTVMHYVGAEPRYWGGSLRETRWQVPPEAGLGEAANDRFFWWVTLRQANTAPDPGQLDTALTPQSETRTFYWAE
jgi:tetratricopeptide (TPR) repeat protein